MKRNGKIELLRFIASVYVLMFHIDKYVLTLPPFKFSNEISLAFFPHGSVGVEFFFLVSGYLMARTAFKHISDDGSVLRGKEFSANCFGFMKRKYQSIFPYHAAAFVFATVTYVISMRYDLTGCLRTVFGSIPSFLLIQMSGIRLVEPNHVEWYISAMLIGMALLYPVCLKYYHAFTKLFAPLTAVLLIGYMQATSHRLTGVSVWNGIAYKSVFRAIAELALGASAFELSKYLSSVKWKKSRRYFFAFAEIVCFSLFSLYVFYYGHYNYEVVILIFLFVLVTLAFSGISAGAKWFDNRFNCYLGGLSLPVYLANLPAIYCTNRFFASYGAVEKLLITVGLVIVFVYAIRVCGNLLKKFMISDKKNGEKPA